MKKTTVLIALLLVGGSFPSIMAARNFVPPPLRVYIPFEAAWQATHDAIESRNLEILVEDRAKGFVVTTFYEYSSGPLTNSHISKIGEKPKLLDGVWVRVTYQYEVLVELVTAKEVLVTVYANIKALKRTFLGEEEWVDIPTTGQLEETFLTSFGKTLFGDKFEIDQPRKGFWERDPTYLPDIMERIPRVAGPERP